MQPTHSLSNTLRIFRNYGCEGHSGGLIELGIAQLSNYETPARPRSLSHAPPAASQFAQNIFIARNIFIRYKVFVRLKFGRVEKVCQVNQTVRRTTVCRRRQPPAVITELHKYLHPLKVFSALKLKTV